MTLITETVRVNLGTQENNVTTVYLHISSQTGSAPCVPVLEMGTGALQMSAL